MKPSKTLKESLDDMQEVETLGDLRRVVSNSMLALVRKEISATDLGALANGLDSISNSLNAEVKLAKTQVELREKGGRLGDVVQLGKAIIGSEKKYTAED